jgi:uncharacterized protein (TIGR02145 family)
VAGRLENWRGETDHLRECVNHTGHAWYICPDITNHTAGVVGNDLPLNNKSGFLGFSGCHRFHVGSFDDPAEYGFWWSSSDETTSTAWLRGLGYGGVDLFKANEFKNSGCSVRLVRDFY